MNHSTKEAINLSEICHISLQYLYSFPPFCCLLSSGTLSGRVHGRSLYTLLMNECGAVMWRRTWGYSRLLGGDRAKEQLTASSWSAVSAPAPALCTCWQRLVNNATHLRVSKSYLQLAHGNTQTQARRARSHSRTHTVMCGLRVCARNTVRVHKQCSGRACLSSFCDLRTANTDATQTCVWKNGQNMCRPLKRSTGKKLNEWTF